MIRVMLVDDEPLILEGLTNIIDWESLGYEVVATARDGQEALEMANDIVFDVLITDIRMPELTGLELIEEINKKRRYVKTMILSGYQEFDLVKEGLKLGIENYLLKPIKEEELVSSLAHIKEKINKVALEEQSTLVLRDHVIWRWIVGKIEYEEFIERISLYPELQLRLPFRFGLIKLAWEGQNDHFLYSLQVRIEKETKAVAVITPSGNIFLIWHGQSTQGEWEFVKKQLLLLLKSLSVSETPIFVYSRIIEAMELVQQAYRDLDMRSELKMLLPDKEYGITDKLYLNGNGEAPSSHNELESYLKPEMLEHLANRRYDVVRLTMDELLMSLECEKSPLVMKSVLLEFFFQLKNKLLISMEYNQYIQMTYQIIYIQSRQEAMKIIDQCFQLLDQESSQESAEFSPIIHTIVTYVHQNYAEDMSLKTLGNSFHINPIYLGQLFQKEVNSSFTKYLNKLRIERAKKLLMNSYEKAGHIGKKVGYTDATYFYKQFKKFEHMTPSEWRKQNIHH
ncbi:response regulator [Alkalihalobacillus sp. 1P02AB]|uniref:response regulator transcription factor n=1 Tax=Alkalihalobacillus sp. 1P02AB TaxID=3132260 RepID=UPI0039A6A47A